MSTSSRPRWFEHACWLSFALTACASVDDNPPPQDPAPPQALVSPLPPAPPPPPPVAPPDPLAVVACSTDAECGWDDHCRPQRCGAPSPTVGCDKSSEPPGACLCLAGACTLKPTTPPPPTGNCQPRACEVDRAGGRCIADDGGVPEATRSVRPVDVGPSCDCIEPARGCTYTWFEPVPCATDRDCWISPSPRRHPIARPANLRNRDFKPCADGEAAPRCDAGQCIVGPAYSC